MGNIEYISFIPRKPISIKIRLVCGEHCVLVYDNKGHTELYSLDYVVWC